MSRRETVVVAESAQNALLDRICSKSDAARYPEMGLMSLGTFGSRS